MLILSMAPAQRTWFLNQFSETRLEDWSSPNAGTRKDIAYLYPAEMASATQGCRRTALVASSTFRISWLRIALAPHVEMSSHHRHPSSIFAGAVATAWPDPIPAGMPRCRWLRFPERKLASAQAPHPDQSQANAAPGGRRRDSRHPGLAAGAAPRA